MPRKPKGEKPMTGAERAKAHRARKTLTPVQPPKLSAASLSAPWVLPILSPPPILSPMAALLKDEVGVPPGDAFLKTWLAASESERRAMLDAIGAEAKPDPMETPVIRSKPSQRFTAPVGSLLKGAK